MKICFAPRSLVPIVAVAAMVGLSASPNAARADSESFTLTQGNSAISPFPGFYGTITVNRTSTTSATVSFLGNTVTLGGHTYVYKFGAHAAVDVNVKGSAKAGSFNHSSLSSGGSGNVSAFGTFSQNVDNSAGANKALSSGSFVLTAKSGTTWNNVGEVLKANGDGFEVAAHIFVFEDGASGAVNTGFAAPSVRTPEFGSATLMGLMLLGFGGITCWRRFRKPAMA